MSVLSGLAFFSLGSFVLASPHYHNDHLEMVSPFEDNVKHRGSHCLINKHANDEICPHGSSHLADQSFLISKDCGGFPSQKNLLSPDISDTFFKVSGEAIYINLMLIRFIFSNNFLTNISLDIPSPPPKYVL
tara:strand:- start:1315 stop:1710 length:396 start_codon:yes stop_codon:yes gene_type:complete